MEFGRLPWGLATLKRYPILSNDVSGMSELGAQDADLLPQDSVHGQRHLHDIYPKLMAKRKEFFVCLLHSAECAPYLWWMGSSTWILL